MNSRKINMLSNILTGLSLLALAICLVAWLFQEHKKEKKAMYNQLALGYIGIVVENQLGMGDFLDCLQMVDQRADSLRRTAGLTGHRDWGEPVISPYPVLTQGNKAGGLFFPDSSYFVSNKLVKSTLKKTYRPGQKDSFERAQKYAFNAETEVYVSSSHQEFEDSTRKDMRMYHMRPLPKEFYAELDSLPQQALFNIWPQIIGAIKLWLLISLTIFLMRRNARERQLALETQQQFISNMTHELKTPVATIGVALEAIQDFNILDNPKKTDEYLSISRKELGRLSNLIDQVLHFSKNNKQELKEIYELQPLQLDKVLLDVMDSLQLKFEQKKAVVHSHISPNLAMKGDATHLANLFRNLLDNALKYSDEGVEITLEAHQEGKQTICIVRDNGWGIPEAYQKKIFNQFFRVPTGDLHNVKGYGLGLSYVAEVVEGHGGKITVNSKEGEGTEMKVIFQ